MGEQRHQLLVKEIKPIWKDVYSAAFRGSAFAKERAAFGRAEIRLDEAMSAVMITREDFAESLNDTLEGRIELAESLKGKAFREFREVLIEEANAKRALCDTVDALNKKFDVQWETTLNSNSPRTEHQRRRLGWTPSGTSQKRRRLPGWKPSHDIP